MLAITQHKAEGPVNTSQVVSDFTSTVLVKGRSGAVEVPVKVDDEGRLIIATDLNIDVGDISIGAVEQGGRSSEAVPWEVKFPEPQEVTLSGQSEVTKVVDAETVTPGTHFNWGKFFSVDGREKEIWLAVASDQPWSISRIRGAFGDSQVDTYTLPGTRTEQIPTASSTVPSLHFVTGVRMRNSDVWVRPDDLDGTIAEKLAYAKSIAQYGPSTGGEFELNRFVNEGDVNATVTIWVIKKY